ncbi:MAG: hypothetical protein H0U85_05235 [Gemmatimonadales bacterium]|nr:hypothetical protein [Gemmatimonadales bacterium]
MHAHFLNVIAAVPDGSLWIGLPSPADLGLDTRRNVLAIPLPNLDRVEYWQLGPEPAAPAVASAADARPRR